MEQELAGIRRPIYLGSGMFVAGLGSRPDRRRQSFRSSERKQFLQHALPMARRIAALKSNAK
ncbi:hypothetical protein [Lacipirellula sp.]|uniref:hypothetical protein n=1 Tax=Lacipirellula sp. TaxID=2691419 RepID=UPI003D13B001